jgi:hypothetical protein
MTRGTVFLERMKDFVGPTVGAILAVVAMGGLLFLAAHLLKGRRDLLKSIVVAAHAKLIAIVGYAVLGLAALGGNPMPLTNPSHAANEVLHPVAAAALAGLDPIALWHSFLLAVGLSVSLEVRPRQAFAAVGGFHALGWLFWIALAALGAQAGGR